MSSDITQFLIAQARGIQAANLPPDVLEVARHSVLDWFGVAIAGATEPLVLKLLAEARFQGGNPLCSVIWHGEHTSPAFAALINGAAADAADFSDVHLAMHGHPTAAVVAAALALRRDSRGRDLDGSERDAMGTCPGHRGDASRGSQSLRRFHVQTHALRLRGHAWRHGREPCPARIHRRQKRNRRADRFCGDT